jgi:Fe-S cluster assembly protein SufD
MIGQPATQTSWLEELQASALARFRADGPPSRRREAWRFTPVAPLLADGYALAPRADTDSAAWAGTALGEDAAWQLPVVNGRPRLDLAVAAPAGVEVRRVADLSARDARSAQQHLGRVDTGDDLAALNAALFDDALVLLVRKGASVGVPIHVVYVGAPSVEATASYPRLLVLAEPRSRAQLVESYLVRSGERHLTNGVSEIVLDRDASLLHTRMVFGADNSYHVGRLAVRQGRDSSYRSHVVTLGGALSRLDVRVELAGTGAEAVLEGVYHAGGREQVDHHVTVVHAEPHGSSRQSYRGILAGTGKAVFDGTTVVEEGAVKTAAQQENRNLLLSDQAVLHTKPHLRIANDDVQCSHGVTVGQLDEEQLFYLRSRGIDADEAAAMLTYGFVRELLAEITEPSAASRAVYALLDRLPQGREIEEELS